MIDVIYDIEVFPNRFCIGMLTDNSCKIIDDIDFVRERINFEKLPHRWIGFNNRSYDHPILEKIKSGKLRTAQDIYAMSQEIIGNSDHNYYSFSKNIIDLYGICPKSKKCSLKEFGHRLGYETLQSLPYPYDSELNDEQWEHVKEYCKHDLDITKMVWQNLKVEFETRQSLKKYFNIPTEFGSAPTLAQNAILSKMGKDVNVSNSKRLIKADNLKLSAESQKLHDEYYALDIKEYYQDKMPELMKVKRSINGVEMKIARGGLHGISSPGIYHDVYEYDVTSYYPSIILNCKIGCQAFRTVYKEIYDRRLALKAKGHPAAASLKLILNSTFGKLKDQYAKPQMQAPNLAVSICLLGQFYLIDLIEKLNPGQCIVANTDGIMCKTPIAQGILDEWQQRTGFNLEVTKYETITVKGMNSYYAIDEHGNEKRKKDFVERDFDHTANDGIIGRAVLQDVLHGVAIEDTIRGCTSIYDFCYFKKAIGERYIEIDGELAESKVRFFVANEGVVITSCKDEVVEGGEYPIDLYGVIMNPPETIKREIRMVADSPVQLCMNIDDSRLSEVNYDWYIKKANKLKEEILK